MNERVEMKQNFFRLFSFSVRNVNRTIECHNKSVFVTFWVLKFFSTFKANKKVEILFLSESRQTDGLGVEF